MLQSTRKSYICTQNNQQLINMKSLYAFWVSLLLLTGFVTAQSKDTYVPKDQGAIDVMSMAKRFLKNTNYPQALRLFEDVMVRPYNQTTTSSVYFLGLTYYNLKDYANAKQYFDLLINEFPLSKFADEAKFYLALIDIESKDEAKQLQALNAFYDLYGKVPDGDLSKECINIVKDFLFYKASSALAIKFYEKANKDFKLEAFEAACYRLVQEDKKAQAKDLLKKFTANGGQQSKFLEVLLAEKKVVPKIEVKNIMKIAMFLPLYVDNTNVEALNDIPAKSQVALELYEGFNMAIEQNAPKSSKQIYLKVFDTQRDNNILGSQLAELEDLYPDVLVGEVFNKQSRVLAEWAENKGVTQIVPLSPTLNLTEGRQNTFLARPSGATHGKKMADFAFYQMGLRKVAVWNDKKAVTVEMAKAFEDEFKTLGGSVAAFTIDSMYQRSIGQIPYVMNGVKNQGCDGMYMPMGNEESIGLALSYLGNNSGVKVMTSPDIENFYTMDRELKEKIGIFFTTSYNPDENSTKYVNFYNNYIAKYSMAPTETNIRGYDLGLWLLKMIDEYTPEKGTFSQFIRTHLRSDAIHLDYQFEGKQDNQAIHIMQYTPMGLLKRNN